MKCTSKIKIRLPIPDNKTFVRFEDKEKECKGEMIEVGKIDTGKKEAYSDGGGNSWIKDVKVTLYQCGTCKTVKLV